MQSRKCPQTPRSAPVSWDGKWQRPQPSTDRNPVTWKYYKTLLKVTSTSWISWKTWICTVFPHRHKQHQISIAQKRLENKRNTVCVAENSNEKFLDMHLPCTWSHLPVRTSWGRIFGSFIIKSKTQLDTFFLKSPNHALLAFILCIQSEFQFFPKRVITFCKKKMRKVQFFTKSGVIFYVKKIHYQCHSAEKTCGFEFLCIFSLRRGSTHHEILREDPRVEESAPGPSPPRVGKGSTIPRRSPGK